MNHAALPVLVVISSAVPGALIFTLGRHERARAGLNLFGAVFKIALVVIMLLGVAEGQEFEARAPLLGPLGLVLRADPLALLFVSLSAGLWLLTTIYALAYFAGRPHQARFFGFFSLCVSATTGIALAGNLLTFLLFYELLTLSTYPLVVHHGDRASLRVGRRYLAYTLSGGVLLFVAVVWAHSLAGPFEFGQANALADADPAALRALFAVFVVGLAVKTAMVPVHGWLPQAMVAPAPVSALLHAVAVVKAGAFGLLRVIYDVFGPRLSEALDVLQPLAIAAAVTILYGSVRALVQDDLKKMLAYSTISQVSYIVLGAALFGPVATIGGLAHLVHQGVMKITLFFCAGAYAELLGVHSIRDLDGIGRRLPGATLAFTIAALGMIGLPPLAGFVSKWYLALGAVTGPSPRGTGGWVVLVLLASTALNAAYFLPVLRRAWFEVRTEPWPDPPPPQAIAAWRHRWLVAPALVTAALTVALGLLAPAGYSATAWAVEVVTRRYFE